MLITDPPHVGVPDFLFGGMRPPVRVTLKTLESIVRRYFSVEATLVVAAAAQLVDVRLSA
jgi:hypothetical protein